MVSLHGVYDKKETKSDVLKVEKLKLLSVRTSHFSPLLA